MKKQAQLIFTHLGEEKQRLKAKEERLELEIALNKIEADKKILEAFEYVDKNIILKMGV